METMTIYVVCEWMAREYEQNMGFYRVRSDAEYIRDHLEALGIKSYVESAPVGKRDEMSKNVHWLGNIQGWSIEEEEVFL